MLLVAPFGQLSYLAALARWTLIGVAVFAAMAGKRIADWRILIPVVMSPAAPARLHCGDCDSIGAGRRHSCDLPPSLRPICGHTIRCR
jgi:hypothetical protein